ncbi:MAG: esterase [Candidatus Eisenbacteria bacterium]|uniref:Esterase n=1 Tax=Eiseniibacteriota bacterium TaxID=2212470 RepID=A0A948RS86_UNCEI|nr:esterase [Candidatus Eisenbacteria bacterium]MBU1951006.1 esterase [Candidatus Eisenbacteria bacterium]MBU2690035.1 esterase [Candidatus Eisenbacteria bacterium]
MLIYLPAGYDDSPELSYPLITCLAGFTGTGRQLLHDRPWRPSLARMLEKLCDQGIAGPMILAFPDGFTRLGGSQYKNSAAVGRYEDHIIGEFLPAVLSQYRVLNGSGHCGIMGMSSGGYGSLCLAMRHPGCFGALASHSGDLYFPYCYIPNFPKSISVIQRHGGVLGFLKAFDDLPRKTGEYIAGIDMIAMSACYSPRENGAFDLPFDLETGRIRPEVWQRWLVEDPINMIEEKAYQDALRGMRLVYFDCGAKDEYFLHYGARMLSERLKALGIEHYHEEFNDTHSGMSYRPNCSLPMLWNALKGD